MRYWIFRGSREDFDIDEYLKNYSYIYWAVKHAKHQNEISIGDKVFIWRSKGKTKDPYGIVAFGVVVELPTHKDNVLHPDNLLQKYWNIPEVSDIKVGIEITSPRLNIENGLIDSSLLLSDEELSGMQLLTARQGTNFTLTERQYQKIYLLWSGDTFDIEEDEYTTIEGKAKIRLHKVRERDRTLVKKAKDKFIKNNGCLYCEACGFNFNDLYKIDYAEAHHKKLVSKIKAGEKTKVSDLAILCANCHRAVHRIKSDDPWQELLRIHGKL